MSGNHKEVSEQSESLKTLALKVLNPKGLKESNRESLRNQGDSIGGSVGHQSDSSSFNCMRDAIKSTGNWSVVPVRDGRIRIVRDLKPLNPANIVAVWNFRRVQIGSDFWMIGVRDDGREIAWRVKERKK